MKILMLFLSCSIVVGIFAMEDDLSDCNLQFFEAVKQLNKPKIKKSIKAGAHIDACSFSKTTAFFKPAVFYATKKGRSDIATLLLRKNADVSFTDKRGRNILHRASFCGLIDVVKFLVTQKNVDREFKDSANRTAIMYAAERGHMDTLKFLVREHGANKYQKDLHGRTALAYGIHTGQREVVTFFLDNDPDMQRYFDPSSYLGRFYTRYKYTNNPLTTASQKGYTDIVIALLEAGAPVKIDEEFEINHLQVAAQKGFLEIVEQLLAYGADVNYCGKVEMPYFGDIEDDPTPLISAADEGHYAIVKMLLDHGANPTLKCNGRTALDFVSWHIRRLTVKDSSSDEDVSSDGEEFKAVEDDKLEEEIRQNLEYAKKLQQELDNYKRIAALLKEISDTGSFKIELQTNEESLRKSASSSEF